MMICDNVIFVVFLLVFSFLCFVVVFMIMLNGILKGESWVFFVVGMSGVFIVVVVIFLI